MLELGSWLKVGDRSGTIQAWGVERGFSQKIQHPIQRTSRKKAHASGMPHVLICFLDRTEEWWPLAACASIPAPSLIERKVTIEEALSKTSRDFGLYTPGLADTKAKEEKFTPAEMPRITREQIKNDYFAVHEFVSYFQWLAAQDDGFALTAGQVITMFELGVRRGIMWDDAANEVGLPECDDWHNS